MKEDQVERREQVLVDAIKIDKKSPTNIVVNPTLHSIYLSYKELNHILVIDEITKIIIARIKVVQPSYMAVNSSTNMIYAITNGNVSIIDGSTNKLLRTIELDSKRPCRSLEVNSSTNRIYLTCYFSNVLHVIDGFTNNCIAVIGIKDPRSIAIDSIRDRIYVGSNSNFISVIDSRNELVERFEIPCATGSSTYQDLDFISINPYLNLLYAKTSVTVGFEGGSATAFQLHVIDIPTMHVINTYKLGGDFNPKAHLVNPFNNTLYVIESRKNEILKLDGHAKKTTEIVRMIEMGFWKSVFTARFESIAYSPVTNKIYIPDGRFGLLYMVDG